MSDNEIGFNYFTIVKTTELSDGYYRLTISNNYVRTNDVDIILYCIVSPIIGNRVELKMFTI